MRRGDHRGVERGFTYVWVMAALAVMGVMLAAVGTSWAEETRREREQDLIRAGAAYARAIASYRASSPGSVAMAPRQLEHLVLDDRFPRPRRHLRQLYADPVEPDQAWGLITDADGRIQGVYSRSERAPLKQVAFDVDGIVLPAASRYSDWKFIVRESKRDGTS
jgi:type II secretory pathway pseudopilin PulG